MRSRAVSFPRPLARATASGRASSAVSERAVLDERQQSLSISCVSLPRPFDGGLSTDTDVRVITADVRAYGVIGSDGRMRVQHWGLPRPDAPTADA